MPSPAGRSGALKVPSEGPGAGHGLFQGPEPSQVADAARRPREAGTHCQWTRFKKSLPFTKSRFLQVPFSRPCAPTAASGRPDSLGLGTSPEPPMGYVLL